MRLAFLIDKFQTFQIIAGLVLEASARKHDCSVFCTFSPTGQVESLLKGRSVNFFYHDNRNSIIKKLAESRKEYDAVLGINLFNSSLAIMYENDNPQNYAFEYCWNEIYNQRNDFNSAATLFCNSGQTLEMINSLCNFNNTAFVGSPWFEFLSKFRQNDATKNRITVLAPHNSMYSHFGGKGLRKRVEKLMLNLREFCDDRQLMLSLKTRQKYSQDYRGIVSFDEIVTDDDILNHVTLYASSRAVLHFCSSAINELSNLNVPFIAAAPDYQKRLHPGTRHESGIGLIHQKYYSGDIFDDVHCAELHSNDITDRSLLFNKLDSLISGDKDWDTFLATHFLGDHQGSSARVMDIIEKRHVELNKDTADV